MSIELASYRRHRSVGQPILYTPNLCGLHQPYGNGLQTLNGKGKGKAACAAVRVVLTSARLMSAWPPSAPPSWHPHPLPKPRR